MTITDDFPNTAFAYKGKRYHAWGQRSPFGKVILIKLEGLIAMKDGTDSRRTLWTQGRIVGPTTRATMIEARRLLNP